MGVDMKKYLTYIKENENSNELSIEDSWIFAIEGGNNDEIYKFIDDGIDVNIQDEYGRTALMLTSSIETFRLLLKQPGIDINIKDNRGYNALLESSSYNSKYINQVKLLLEQPNIDIATITKTGFNFIDLLSYKYHLKNYDLQKKIIENDRDDIILLLNEYGLVDEDIKKDYPDLFNTIKWGLI
jgi:ankyrin repeat protein